jgi:hypothetical protein
MYYGCFKLVANKEARYKAIWFYPNDKNQCVLGDVSDSIQSELQVPNVWPIFISTRFTCIKVASLEDIRFNVFRQAHAKVGGDNPKAYDIPISKQDNKTVHVQPLERIMILGGYLRKN